MTINPVIIRTFLSIVFLYSGATKLIFWSDGVAEFTAIGLPLPVLALIATIAVQLVGGIGLLFGRYVTFCACLLAIFTVVATLIGHPFWTFSGVDFQRQLTTALEHLAIVGGLLAVTHPVFKTTSASHLPTK